MKKSFSRLLAFAAAACLAVAQAVHASYAYIRNVFADLALFMRSPEPHGSYNSIEPRVTLLSAKAFRERLAKRDRPKVTARWRLCPSAG